MVERDVRKTLNIPFNPGAPALRYEHSMGQGLPDFIHRIGMKQTSAVRRRSRCSPSGRRSRADVPSENITTFSPRRC